MKRSLGLLFLLLSLGGCGDSGERPTATPPEPSPTAEPTQAVGRRWVAAIKGAYSVEGYIQPSDSGLSIEYVLEMEGPTKPAYIILNFPGGGLFAQSGPLSGERFRRGYLSLTDGDGNSVAPVLRHPRGLKLRVAFKDGPTLVSKLHPSPP